MVLINVASSDCKSIHSASINHDLFVPDSKLLCAFQYLTSPCNIWRQKYKAQVTHHYFKSTF